MNDLEREETKRLNEYLDGIDRDYAEEEVRLDAQEDALRSFLINEGFNPTEQDIMYLSDVIETVTGETSSFDRRLTRLLEDDLGHEVIDEQVEEIGRAIRMKMRERDNIYNTPGVDE